MRISPYPASAILALTLAFGLVLRVFSQNNGFRNEVMKTLATTEGYDQKFIDLVNHLEEVLTTRARFAYPGGKDPMTGRRREVASATTAARPSPRKESTPRPSKPRENTRPVAAAPAAEEPAPDRVKLTAIIADDYGQHTAIVMDGERSISVDVGDSVGTRKVTRITGKEIVMEDETGIYSYDLNGNRDYRKK